MKMTNSQIYYTANAFTEVFADFNQYIPVKVNFALQKNAQALAAAAKEIEAARMEIAKHYGELDAEAQRYNIPNENMPAAEQELNDLFNIEQDLPIKTISIDAFGNIELTPAQMQVIMFMIDEE